MNEEKKEKKALFPGSFNPIHIGHLDIIKLASKIYDVLYIFVADNESKKYSVKIDKRFDVVEKLIQKENLKNVKVFKQGDFLTTPIFAKKNKISTIVRGNKEKILSKYESTLADEFLEDNENLDFHYFNFEDNDKISSSYIKEKIEKGEKITGLVPESVEGDIIKLWNYEKR